MSEASLGIMKVVKLIENKLQGWLELGVKNLPNFVVAIIVTITFYYLSKLARNLLRRVVGRITPSNSVQNLLESFVYFGINGLGFFISLGVLNLDKTVTSLLAGAGVIGLAIGFAFQDIASNFVSGVFIAIQRPFKKGDIIKSKNHLGEVTSINLRTTTITTFQGIETLIPNKELFVESLSNYTNTPIRRIDLTVGVSYADNLQKIEDLVVKELESLPNRISRPIDVFFTDFADSSINLNIHIWVKYPDHRNYLVTRSEAIKKVKDAFDGNEITIPFPIRTLDFGIKGGKSLREMRDNI